MTTMMEVIDGNSDIAKHIWGFFLEFDDDDEHTTMTPPPSTVNYCVSETNAGRKHRNNTDRRIDFSSIRSLRSVNKFFCQAFEESCGWSRCALAIRREYQSLQNHHDDEPESWSFVLQSLRVDHPTTTATRGGNRHPNRGHSWTREQRLQVGRILSRAMERKKLSVYRCNQLVRMLDRGPFTKDQKILARPQICVVH